MVSRRGHRLAQPSSVSLAPNGYKKKDDAEAKHVAAQGTSAQRRREVSSRNTQRHRYQRSRREFDTRGDDCYRPNDCHSRDSGSEFRDGSSHVPHSRRRNPASNEFNGRCEKSRGSSCLGISTGSSRDGTNNKRGNNTNKLDDDNMAFWSSLSVRVAMAVMKAKGSDLVAKEAANAVLGGNKMNRPTSSYLGTLATKVSVAVLEAGGSQDVASAVTVAIVNSEDDKGRDLKKSIRGINCNDRGNTSSDDAVASPSMMAKRRGLKAKEDEIARKTEALEKAERLHLQKEKEINEKMAEAARLEEAKSTLGHNNGLLTTGCQDRSLGHHLNPQSSKQSESFSETSGNVSSTPSMRAQQRKLKEKEDEIAQKKMAVEEAALLQRQKEKEISDRMAEAARLNLQMENNISERLAALDAAEAALRERGKKLQQETDRRNALLKLQEREKDTRERMLAMDAAEAALRETDMERRVTFDGEKPGPTAGGGKKSVPNSNFSKPLLQTDGRSKTPFDDLTGQLYSFLGASWVSSPISSVPRTLENVECQSYSTNASASTAAVTNRTGDASKATRRTAMSALTEEYFAPKYHSNAEVQNTNAANKDLMNQTLHTAMKQHAAQIAEVDPVEESVYSQNSAREPSSKHTSSTPTSSKSSMTKRTLGIFSFSKKSSARAGKKSVSTQQRYLI